MEAATNCNVENLEAEAGVLIQICGAELGAVCSFWGKAEAFMTNYRVVADVC